jgi:hypothetical protein
MYQYLLFFWWIPRSGLLLPPAAGTHFLRLHFIRRAAAQLFRLLPPATFAGGKLRTAGNNWLYAGRAS